MSNQIQEEEDGIKRLGEIVLGITGRLPCDVKVAPSTVIHQGAPLSALMNALDIRRKAGGRHEIKEAPPKKEFVLTIGQIEMVKKLYWPSPDGDDLETELFFQLGDGHSGYGVYVSLLEYPEEGSTALFDREAIKHE